ncbi:H(+)-transporting V1 sector ATPase subunit F [Aspergillus terreus]
MAATAVSYKDRQFLAVIGDEDSVTGLLLAGIGIAERIRHSVDSFADAFPAVLEIPSKDHPYDPEKDSVLKRVRRLFGE